MRAQVAAEIMNTEQTYFGILDALKDVFIDPLRKSLNSSRPLLSSEEIGLIFSNIDFIRSINGAFVNALKNRIEKYSPSQKLGDVFLEVIPQFQYSYSQYINNYDQAMKTLSWCQQKHPPFDEFLKV